MARIAKLLAAMRRNPRGDWRIEDLKTIADRFGIPYRQPGTSHVTFAPLAGPSVTVPAHKPIKLVYVRQFLPCLRPWRTVMTTGLDYPFTVRPLGAEEGGGWLCEFPDLPGCMADGATPEEAIREGADALRSCILTLRELGRPVPPPSRSESSYSGRWVMRVPKALHRRLAEQARAEGVSLNALAATLLAEGLGYRRGRQASDRRMEPAQSA